MNRIPDDHWLRVCSVAHRGIQTPEIPENTLESCVLAAEKGYPIEFDVKLTREGNVILLHDQSLKRIAGINKFYSKITQYDIDTIKYLNSECKIATFPKLLDAINGRVPLLIELKFPLDVWRMKLLVSAVSSILSGYKGEYAIQSFVPNICKLYKKVDSKTFIGLIGPITSRKNNSNEKKLISNIEADRYDFITYDIEYYPDSLKHYTSIDKPLLFYYITNKEKEKEAKSLGANLIWADYENIGYEAPKLVRR